MRQVVFYTSIVTLLITVLSNVLAYCSYTFTHEDKEAILLSSVVTVKSSPGCFFQRYCSGDGGLKVEQTQQTLSGYTEVKYSLMGTVGWVSNDSFELITILNKVVVESLVGIERSILMAK